MAATHKAEHRRATSVGIEMILIGAGFAAILSGITVIQIAGILLLLVALTLPIVSAFLRRHDDYPGSHRTGSSFVIDDESSEPVRRFDDQETLRSDLTQQDEPVASGVFTRR